eukprot:scaffold15908_cov132-Cylindrotheca_fusiformis.AAC.5
MNTRQKKKKKKKTKLLLMQKKKMWRFSGADESVKRQRFGESIVGDRRGEISPYEISFLDSVDWRLLCKKFTAEGRSAEAEGCYPQYLLF